jgi:hypothetical protein
MLTRHATLSDIIAARRAHIVRMSQYCAIESQYMRFLLNAQARDIARQGIAK